MAADRKQDRFLPSNSSQVICADLSPIHPILLRWLSSSQVLELPLLSNVVFTFTDVDFAHHRPLCGGEEWLHRSAASMQQSGLRLCGRLPGSHATIPSHAITGRENRPRLAVAILLTMRAFSYMGNVKLRDPACFHHYQKCNDVDLANVRLNSMGRFMISL